MTIEERVRKLEHSNHRLRAALGLLALPLLALLFLGQQRVEKRVVAEVVSADEIVTKKLTVRGATGAAIETTHAEGLAGLRFRGAEGDALTIGPLGVVVRNRGGYTATVLGRGVLHLSDPAATDGKDHRQVMIRAFNGGGGRFWLSAGHNTAFVVEGHPDRTIEAMLGDLGGKQVGWEFSPAAGARALQKK